MDETGFSPSRDLKVTRNSRLITATNYRAVIPRADSRYIPRISVLMAIFGDFNSSLPSSVLQGSRDSTLSNVVETTKVFELVPPSWKAYWQAVKSLHDRGTFMKWVREFIALATAYAGNYKDLVLFYDALRSCMT